MERIHKVGGSVCMLCCMLADAVFHVQADAILQQPSLLVRGEHPRVKEIYIELCRFVDLKDSSVSDASSAW